MPLRGSAYGLLYAVAITAAVALGAVRLRRAGVSRHQILWSVAVILWGGVAGAYAGYWLVAVLHRLTASVAFAWHPGGTTIIGALAGGALAGVVLWRAMGLEVWRVLDGVAPAVPLGQAIGRIGCHTAGCCWGRATSSWLGVALPDGAGMMTRRYPTQLMSAALDLAIMVVLLVWEARTRRPGGEGGWPFPGFLFLLYLELYALKRAAVELLRDTAPAVLGSLTWVHFVCLAALVATTVTIAVRLRHARSCGGPVGVSVDDGTTLRAAE